MAREISKGRGGRNSGSKTTGKKYEGKKSGWNKPDGTPLRKRKGDYFPDKEIESKKPGARGKSFRPDSGEREFSKTRPDSERREYGKPRPDSERREYSKPRPDSEKREYSKSRPDSEKREYSKSRPDSERREYSKSRPDSERRPYSKSRPDSEKREFSNDRSEREPRGERADGERTYDRKKSGYERKKPFEKKREKYAKKDHSKEMRGRFDRTEGGDRNARKKYAGPHRERKTSTASEPGSKDAIRLNRYIANAGICSRREADDLITAGLVSINGEIVTELGTKVMPGDEVKFHDRVLKTEKLVYVLLNKPKDFITTTDDPSDRKTVMNLISDACKERIVPVGRLDRNTTGLLLITNDGVMTKRLTHPSSNIKKLYQVELDRNVTQADMIKATEGVELEDGIASFDEIQFTSQGDKNIVGVELHSGKNRIVRRIFEALGYNVKKLDRTIFAGLTKKDLPRGRWRFLTEMEINMLKMLTGKK